MAACGYLRMYSIDCHSAKLLNIQDSESVDRKIDCSAEHPVQDVPTESGFIAFVTTGLNVG